MVFPIVGMQVHINRWKKRRSFNQSITYVVKMSSSFMQNIRLQWLLLEQSPDSLEDNLGFLPSIDSFISLIVVSLLIPKFP
jgi:hypothetical protein